VALRLAVAGGVAANWFVLIVEWLWELARFPGQGIASVLLDLDVADRLRHPRSVPGRCRLQA